MADRLLVLPAPSARARGDGVTVAYLEFTDDTAVAHLRAPTGTTSDILLAGVARTTGPRDRRTVLPSPRHPASDPDASFVQVHLPRDRMAADLTGGSRPIPALAAEVIEAAAPAEWRVEMGCTGCGGPAESSSCQWCTAALASCAPVYERYEDRSSDEYDTLLGVALVDNVWPEAPFAFGTIECWSQRWILHTHSVGGWWSTRPGHRAPQRLGPTHRRLVATDDQGRNYSAPQGTAVSGGGTNLVLHDFWQPLGESKEVVVNFAWDGQSLLTYKIKELQSVRGNLGS